MSQAMNDTRRSNHPKAGSGHPSRLRITAAVFGLILGGIGLLLVLVILFSKPTILPSTPTVGFMNFLLLIGSIGSLVTGIVLLAKQRKRGGATPWLALAFAVVGLVGAAGLPFRGPAVRPILVLVALAPAILSAFTVWNERRKGAI